MGSPLGSTFADFYMSNLKNLVLDKNNSILNFTYEKPADEYFSFLDVKIKVTNSKVETGIHVKATDKGLYFDYRSYVPMTYKFSLIKILTNRAYKLCSTWFEFDSEIKRITFNLINNNFPQSIIEKNIKFLIDKLYNKNNSINNESK